MSEISLAGLQLTPEERKTVRTGLATASAFQAVVPEVSEPLPLKGIHEFTVNRLTSRWVGEGEDKVSGASVGTVEMKPSKQVAAFVETMEAGIESPEIAQALISTAPSAFADTFDRTIVGLDGFTAPNPYFGVLTSAATINVVDDKDFVGVLGSVAGDGGTPSAVVLTTAAYYKLRALRTALGTPIFPELANTADPRIEGLQVKLIVSNVAAGWTGDFARQARWGVAVPEFLQVKNAGTITDLDGKVHNLTTQNKTAYLIETFLGFNFTDAKYFRQLTFNDAPAA